MASESEKPFYPLPPAGPGRLARRRSVLDSPGDVCQKPIKKRDLDQALLDTLLKAGITGRKIREMWGVALWSLRMKDGGVQVKVDTSRNPGVDRVALTRWLADLLKSVGPVTLKEKPMRKCCDSRCRGCLCGNPKQRAAWFLSD